MPGPRSAPNGIVSLTERKDSTKMVKSGKTAVKRGEAVHVRKK